MKKERGRLCRPPCFNSLRLSSEWLIHVLTLRADLVERRIRHLEALYLRRPLNHVLQLLQHGGVRLAAIRLGAFPPVPQTDRDGLVAIGREKRDLILEPGLPAQDWEHVRLELAREIGGLVGLEVQRDVTSEHGDSLSA